MRSSKKISIDFSQSSIELLERAKENLSTVSDKKASNSLIVNTLIETVFGCNSNLKSEIVKAIGSIKCHYNLLQFQEEESSYLKKEYKSKIRELDRIQLLFNVYNNCSSDNNLMRRLQLSRKRCLNIPSNWIVVNTEDAERCTRVFVLECRNRNLYNIPHFVFLADATACESQGELKQSSKDVFFDKILHLYPDFQFVLDNQIEINYANGIRVMDSQWEKAPTIGIFEVIDSEKLAEYKKSGFNYEPAFGAVVEVGQ